MAAGKITMLTKPIKNIVAVTNKDPTTGGVDQESDEDLRQRIVDYDQAQGVSYVGSVSDYTRWAMEVTGVGAVKVIPANNGTGIVKLVITDANGAPASAELCKDVFEHIMSPGIPALRIAPVNSQLIVVPPETLRISISAKIVNESGVGIKAVRNDLLTALGEYYKTAMVNGVVRYNEIGGILIDIPGVADYGNLMVNGGNANLSLDEDIMPLTEIADLSGVII
ncbi:MAG: hypothetical protein EUB_03426 [Eubacterium sp.]